MLRRDLLVFLGGLMIGSALWVSSVGMFDASRLLNLVPVTYQKTDGNFKPVIREDFPPTGVVPLNASVSVDSGPDLQLSENLLDAGYDDYYVDVDVTHFDLTEILLSMNQADPHTVEFAESVTSSDLVLNYTIERLWLRIEQRLRHANDHSISEVAKTVNGIPLYLAPPQNHGRLGNWLFMTASVYGLARDNRRLPAIVFDYWAENILESLNWPKFNVSEFVGSENKTDQDAVITSESGFAKYTPNLLNISALKGDKNAIAGGYLQSYRYFDHYRDDVRSLLTFKRSVFNQSIYAMKAGIEGIFAKSPETREWALPALVGVHVRRGDAITEEQLKFGNRPASEEYLLRATLHFQRSHAPVLFFVMSDDIPYCKELFPEPNFIFLADNPSEVDIATISLMDHIILSVGTYGWFGAYLSDARKIFYYRDWPKNGTDMYKYFNAEEYFLPSWTPFL